MITSGQNNDVTVPIKRLAAIDLGTNSFHALIVDLYSDGSFRKVDDFKEMVQLAKGGLGKRLTEGAFSRGMKTLKNIKVLCDSHNVEKILAYATSAIRESENGGEFIQASIDRYDIKINAIPGSVEAELIGYAVQHGIRLGEDPVLMIDVGGGSVEFILGNANTFHFLTSKKIGVSRMTDIFKPSDPISLNEIQKLEKHYREQTSDLAEAFTKNRTSTMIGSSGTMQNIATMIAARKGLSVDVTLNEMEYTAQDFFSFYKNFIKLNRTQRRNVKGMDTKRIDFINTGVVLLNFLLREFNIRKVRISTQALREGIIIRYLKKDMIGLPWSGEMSNPRRRSVFELLRKCDWHEAHSRHVANMSLTIFDILKADIELNHQDRELLEYASYLHDIGYYISHSKHHKHALYIIRNSVLQGFREEEIEIIANVTRYHRRSTPKKRHAEYWKLNPTIRKRIKQLSAILRVADGLDRSHYQNVQKLELEIKENELLFKIQVQADPQLEIWGAQRKSHLLREISGKKISFEVMN